MIVFVICVVIVFLEVLIIYPILVINSRITRKEEQKEVIKMYKCDKCGWNGDWSELKKDRQYAGEYQGHDVFELYRVCPNCNSDEVHYYDDWED